MFNLFKKSYKSKFAKKLGRATQHKMFEGCKFRCITSDMFVIYICDNENLGKYMTKKLGEPSHPQSLEITCNKDDSSHNDSNLITLIIPFDEDFSPFLDEELETACQAHNARNNFAAVECRTTYCDIRDEEAINGLKLMISGVTEDNCDEKLDLLLVATYTLLENM